MSFVDLVGRVAQFIDVAGLAIIVGGVLGATIFFAPRWKAGPPVAQYRGYRQTVGRAILLGLEFFLAADIIRTVAIDPTFRSVGVLAIIVAIRTFLSLELELEINGDWPWQRDKMPNVDDTLVSVIPIMRSRPRNHKVRMRPTRPIPNIDR